MKWIVAILYAAGLIGGVAAETVYLTRNAEFDVDWVEPSLWSNGETPSAENDYVSDCFTMRMHNDAPVFSGRSFLVKGNGGISLKTENMVATVTNLVMNGGSVNVASAGHMTLAGDLTVAGGGFVTYTSGDASRSLTVASFIMGSGPIYIGPPNSSLPFGSIAFSNSESTWSGDLLILSDGSASFEYDLIGDSLIFGVADAPVGMLDLNGRAVTFDDLTIGGEVYAAGVYTSTNLPARLQGEGTLTILSTPAQEITLTSLDENGTLSWNSTAAGEWSYTVEWASTPEGPWTNTWDHLSAIISTQTVHAVNVPRFYRVKGIAVDAD
ncbi:hypothetical protein [Pontiella agarivorans]|uniref:G8 domain-containing protein n=1 Tax=Pontiella agarivorans TaxID=3038953 RepID=A0ABU5MX36_9BACT|nr:hypothetical protein [Pontiella agarivorans]MDZ8118758.1 hypothetical protein [Pontiella agarivorans]